MLKLTKLNQFYGQSHTLWDISLEVQKGECLCVMGRNGVGKTTLMDTIMGQHRIESGTIEFDGEDITKLSVEDRASLGIGYVPQGATDLSFVNRRREFKNRYWSKTRWS